MDQLNWLSKWNHTSSNVQAGDVACIRGEQSSPTKWPLTVVKHVHPGKDGKVWVVTIRTSKGMYNRPVTKVVALINDGSRRPSAGGGVSTTPGQAEDLKLSCKATWL